MNTTIDLVVSPQQAADDQLLRDIIRKQYDGTFSKDHHWQVLKRSIDARQRAIKINLRLLILAPQQPAMPWFNPRQWQPVSDDKRAVVIGAGPAGLFAALQLIEKGIKPIVVERGKDVQARRRDLAAIHKEHIVNPDSNYCFGEGGAGTYSDGKLYTRSTKRGDVRRILETLVEFGASEAILQEAHPHIGTNKLPKIIAAIRNKVIELGGEVHFNSKLTDLVIENKCITKALINGCTEIKANAFILATGHSARDIFHLLSDKKIAIEVKPFALGVRAEHPQQIIDSVQYHCDDRGPYLPPAAYNLVHQAKLKSVYSFCMCPGGIIAPCATGHEEVVTNGWSPSKRNNPWANSGIVVPVDWDDVKPFHQHGELAGLAFQSQVEKLCWEAAGKTQRVPAQRMIDFVEGRLSSSLPDCSYQPGLVSARLDQILPPYIVKTLQEGFVAFGKKMRGYYTNEAVLVAPESRTSSPIRIPRNIETLAHTEISNLFPCGEGAGYAGGIVSAAIDGEKVADKLAELLLA